MALGATRKQVVSLIMGQGLQVAAAGLAMGLVLTTILNRAMKDLLVGVSATDPATLTITAAMLLTVAALACYVPARRATRVDPTVALRFE